jgi:hypothetical protein
MVRLWLRPEPCNMKNSNSDYLREPVSTPAVHVPTPHLNQEEGSIGMCMKFVAPAWTSDLVITVTVHAFESLSVRQLLTC